MRNVGLSQEAQSAIVQQLKNPSTANEQFRFDISEFRSQVAFRAVQLDNGGLLSAESENFDNVFDREVVNERTQEVRFSTQGKIVNERLKKSHE